VFSINCNQLGKRYNNEWIFRELTYNFQFGKSYAILGANGSGKSTLLQVISGLIPASEGVISYQLKNQKLDSDNFYRYFSWATPYQELIEELTLTEHLEFQQKFKPNSFSTSEMIETLRLEKFKNQYIKNFSSGMKQRLKLGLAIYSDVPVLLLDEPTTNLDTENTDWYRTEIKNKLSQKLVIIASNQPAEHDFCDFELKIA
jgi:ABC-type multidrug transport system ATPase subunit